MVFCAAVFFAAKAVESKVMLAAPALAAKSSASRKLHAASVPDPGVACAVQFEALAESLSSLFVVTTRFAENCAVTVSDAFMVIPLLAESGLATGSGLEDQLTKV
jgi:hypothetical protein